MRADTVSLTDDDFAERRAPLWRRLLPRRRRDAIAGTIAGLAVLAILINALYLQAGPHPAPIFANKPALQAAPSAPAAASAPQIRAASTDMVQPRPRSDIVADIQRELARRGYYDGAIDGVYGPRTDTAIRDFEQAAGLSPAAEANDALLVAIRKSSIPEQAAAPVRNDPIAQLLAADRRLIAVQRALAEFGYGPLKPTGVHDAQTKAAIERFERARRRPVTGQVSEALVRDLAALTGRPLE